MDCFINLNTWKLISFTFLLNRLNAVNKKNYKAPKSMQSLFCYLIEFKSSQHDKFNGYKEQTLDRSIIKQYKTSISRKKRRKLYNTTKIELVILSLMNKKTLK